MEKQWYLYILRCADDTLYTGITTDVPRRVAAHNAGKGAKYTKGRRPVQVIYWETLPDHSAALRRERKVKSFSRTEKLALGEGMTLSSVDAERPGKEG